MGDATSVPPLVRALADAKAVEERRAIASSLVSLPGKKETDQAVNSDLSRATGMTRAELVSVLARRQGSAANPVLLVEATNPDSDVAKAAWRALARTALADDVPGVLNGLIVLRDADVRAEAETAASQAIARLPEPGRRSALVRDALARAETMEVRCALLGLLPLCGDAPALAELTKAQRESNPSLQEAAVRALAEWPDLEAWDNLANFCDRTTSESLRAVAMRGLVRLAGEENVRPSVKLVGRYEKAVGGGAHRRGAAADSRGPGRRRSSRRIEIGPVPTGSSWRASGGGGCRQEDRRVDPS